MIPSSILRIISLLTIYLICTGSVVAYENNFQVQDLQGVEFTLDQFEGKVLLIEGMTTWCQTCKAEIDPLKEVKTTFGESLAILTVALDLTTDTIASLQDYKFDHEIPWEISLDHKQQLTNYYGISNYPTLFVFDQNGNLAKKWSGYTPASTIIDEVSTLIEIEHEDDVNALAGIWQVLLDNNMFILFVVLISMGFLFRLFKLFSKTILS